MILKKSQFKPDTFKRTQFETGGLSLRPSAVRAPGPAQGPAQVAARRLVLGSANEPTQGTSPRTSSGTSAWTSSGTLLTTVIRTLTFSLQGRRQPPHQDEPQGQRLPEERWDLHTHTLTHTDMRIGGTAEVKPQLTHTEGQKKTTHPRNISAWK